MDCWSQPLSLASCQCKSAITDVSHPSYSPPLTLPPWQLTTLEFTSQAVRCPTIQRIMMTSLFCPPPLSSRANHLRPKTRPQTDKTKSAPKTLHHWSANILLALLSNWSFEETKDICRSSRFFGGKTLPLVESKRSETFPTVAKRDLEADGEVTWLSYY